MAASTIPVTIEDDLVRLTLRTNTQAIADSLEKLNNAISTNARVLASLCDDVATLRSNFEMAQTRTLRRFTQVEEAHEAIVNEVQQNVAVAIRTLQNKCAWKAEVNEEMRIFSTRVKHCESFIDEIETGGGERVQKFVRTYVESFVPRWYESVSGPLWVRVTSAIAKAADDTSKKSQAALLLAEDRHSVLVQSTRRALDERITETTEATAEQLLQLSQSTAERFDAAGAELDAAAKALRLESSEMFSATHDRFCRVEQAAHELRASLCLDQTRCAELLEQALCNVVGGEGSTVSRVFSPPATSLRAPSALAASDEGLLKGEVTTKGPAVNTMARPKGTSSDAAQPKMEQRPARSASGGSTSLRHRSGGAPAAAPGRPSSSGAKGGPASPSDAGLPRTPSGRLQQQPSALGGSHHHASGGGSGSSGAPVQLSREVLAQLSAFTPLPAPGTAAALAPSSDDLPIGRIMAEPRVLYMLRTPYFTALRTVVQDEIEARVAEARAQLQNDLIQHVQEVQHELKAKVNIRRLAEFLHENRDEALYSNVRTLLADVQDLRVHKVDGTHFNEVLRQKADTKSLDLKADKQLVSNNIALLTGRMDTVVHEAGKQQQKLSETELRISELVYWVHTGRTMGEAALRAGANTSNVAEALKLRVTKHGLADRHEIPPHAVALIGTRRDLPPQLQEEDAGFVADADIGALVPTTSEDAATPRSPRSPPKSRGGTRSPLRRQTSETPFGSGRHAHHPQKRVSDCAARDHLQPTVGGGLGSTPRVRGPSSGSAAMPPAVAEYLKLVTASGAGSNIPAAPGSPAERSPRAGEAPDLGVEGQGAFVVKSAREMPDGPPPARPAAGVSPEAVSWTAETAPSAEQPPGDASAGNTAGGTDPVRLPRPPATKLSRGALAKSASSSGLHSTADGPRASLSETSPAASQSARVGASSPPGPERTAAAVVGEGHAAADGLAEPPEKGNELPAETPGAPDGADAKRRKLLGSNVTTVLLRTGAVTQTQLSAAKQSAAKTAGAAKR